MQHTPPPIANEVAALCSVTCGVKGGSSSCTTSFSAVVVSPLGDAVLSLDDVPVCVVLVDVSFIDSVNNKVNEHVWSVRTNRMLFLAAECTLVRLVYRQYLNVTSAYHHQLFSQSNCFDVNDLFCFLKKIFFYFQQSLTNFSVGGT